MSRVFAKATRSSIKPSKWGRRGASSRSTHTSSSAVKLRDIRPLHTPFSPALFSQRLRSFAGTLRSRRQSQFLIDNSSCSYGRTSKIEWTRRAKKWAASEALPPLEEINTALHL
eukprot:RCo004532